MTTTDQLSALPVLAHRDVGRSLDHDDSLTEGQYLLLFDDHDIDIDADGDGSPGDRRLLAIGEDPVTVGRSHSADIALDDPLVSRRHATIVRTGAVVRLHDDESTNGTYVNGRRITETDLVDGDVVAFGRVIVIFRDAAPVTVGAHGLPRHPLARTG
ncbi:MAG: domain containing protein [Solirubrobacterales bacterium]|nr:domain containing protein [Solirubrobacterales bacterium]